MTLNEIVDKLELDAEKKNLYRNLCAVIENNVEENITKTPFELSAETGVPYDKWSDFLETTEINAWVNDTIRIIAKISQRKKLKDLGKESTTTQDVNAYKVLDDYNSTTKPTDNSNVVIMYLPNPNDYDKKD
jgi:phage FluMu gp28-like protein